MPLGSIWLEGGKVGGQKIIGRWKSGRIENILISLFFVWLEVEKWKNRKYFNFSLFCLVGSGKVEGWKK